MQNYVKFNYNQNLEYAEYRVNFSCFISFVWLFFSEVKDYL